MEQYSLPFNKYEDPTVELDFNSSDEPNKWIPLDNEWEYLAPTSATNGNTYAPI